MADPGVLQDELATFCEKKGIQSRFPKYRKVRGTKGPGFEVGDFLSVVLERACNSANSDVQDVIESLYGSERDSVLDKFLDELPLGESCNKSDGIKTVKATLDDKTIGIRSFLEKKLQDAEAAGLKEKKGLKRPDETGVSNVPKRTRTIKHKDAEEHGTEQKPDAVPTAEPPSVSQEQQIEVAEGHIIPTSEEQMPGEPEVREVEATGVENEHVMVEEGTQPHDLQELAQPAIIFRNIYPDESNNTQENVPAATEVAAPEQISLPVSVSEPSYMELMRQRDINSANVEGVSVATIPESLLREGAEHLFHSADRGSSDALKEEARLVATGGQGATWIISEGTTSHDMNEHNVYGNYHHFHTGNEDGVDEGRQLQPGSGGEAEEELCNESNQLQVCPLPLVARFGSGYRPCPQCKRESANRSSSCKHCNFDFKKARQIKHVELAEKFVKKYKDKRPPSHERLWLDVVSSLVRAKARSKGRTEFLVLGYHWSQNGSGSPCAFATGEPGTEMLATGIEGQWDGLCHNFGRRKEILVKEAEISAKKAAMADTPVNVGPEVGDPKVNAWLKDLGLECYTDVFAQYGFGFSALRYIEPSDMERMEVKLGHSRVLKAAIDQLKLAP